MALAEDAPNKAGVILCMLAYDKKGGADMVLAEDVEDLRRPFRIGTVIKRQGYLIRLGILKMRDGGINRPFLVRFANVTVGVDPELAPASFRGQIGCEKISIPDLRDEAFWLDRFELLEELRRRLTLRVMVKY